MPTSTGSNIRTITGYVITLLEYPRYIIEREADFTHCHLRGEYDADDSRCATCQFGAACAWLHGNRAVPPPDSPLDELMLALNAAVDFLRLSGQGDEHHSGDCECDTCQWLHEAKSFLRMQRHRS